MIGTCGYVEVPWQARILVALHPGERCNLLIGIELHHRRGMQTALRCRLHHDRNRMSGRVLMGVGDSCVLCRLSRLADRTQQIIAA
jgi:hypothetical protein